MISDERFFAWLDGEMAPDEAAAVDALVAADPKLLRRAEEHRALGARLSSAFDPIAQASVPDRVAEASRTPDAEVIDFGSLREQRGAPPISARMQWAAMAATLALGLVAGSMINRGPDTPIASEGGQLVASGQLEQALYTRLASAPFDEGARIGLTFHDATGDLCRSFTDDGAVGLACHESADWRIRGLFQAGEGQQAEFRMAAGLDPRLAGLIDSTMAGQPLDATAERKALDALR